MRKHSKKDERILKTTDNRRIYHIIHVVPPQYSMECGVCPRHGICRKHENCNPTKGQVRNWKKFRKNQWKEKR